MTAIEKILASTWLDSNTSRVAVRKLENVRTILWPAEKFLEPMKLEKTYESFPESAASFIEYWIETRRRQRALFGTDAAAEELLISSSKALPYARYTHVLNQLSMPLGALALPLYCPEGTKGMLHGGLLYLYAQALVGALDSDGVRVDPQGNIGPSWLGETSRKAFEQRTFGCLPNSGNIFPEIPAMEVAYASFKRQHQRNDSQLSEELTEEKVFFITACMITCAMTPADNVYGGDCNKAVMNFAPFAEAFQCAPGSNMNPERKCTFFD
ncbi:endothelin-converting enzyme 1-like [Rhipicephalus microplus]|uniref:endothelin-converting enzyme 1-like n=1 Tax=Rhipicephalus microplus TaxID=6941 RepID=UPI003F6B28AE